MNDLSWFLYLADILGNVQVLLGIVGFASIVLFGFAAFGFFFNEDRPRVGLVFAGLAVLGFLILVTATLIPSKHTIYAIAASQAGEHILKLEEVQALGGDLGGLATDSLKLLRQTINSQLENAND